MMRFSSSVLLTIGAVLLSTHCRGIQSFTIGRNISVLVDNGESQVTATDDSLDTKEHAQNNTSIEDDVHNHSLEIKDRLIKNILQFVKGLIHTDQVQIPIGDADDNFSLEDHPIGSNDQLQTPNVNHDDNHDTHSMEGIVTIHHQQANQTADDLSNQFQLHFLEVQGDLVKRNAPVADANHVQPGTATDVRQLQTSTPDVFLPSPVSVFDNQPIVGIFGHPTSDDLYLVKEYFGDYYFWEIEHKLVRDSLLEPIKNVFKLDSDPPIKVDAIQFAQFTPVRELWDDRKQAISTTLEDQLARLNVPVVPNVRQLQTSVPNVFLPSSVSLFDDQPIVGIFSHPASDDLYLVKEYLGDYYFWEIEHKLVLNSLLEPVKNVFKLDSDPPIKVDAVQFAQFQPVRALWDDRKQADSTTLEDQLARLKVPMAANARRMQMSTPEVFLPSSVSIFDDQPIVGIFGHPASDDLYLVKEYLGDYYFWEIEHKLVRDSLLKPVKDVFELDSDSPIKVDAVQFAQFTPVRSLWDDRQQAASTAV